MRTLTIIAMLLVSVAIYSQRMVTVYVQTPSLAGYDQYWSAKYGLENFIDEREWTLIDQGRESFLYYSKSYDAYMTVLLCQDKYWDACTDDFISDTRNYQPGNKKLFVYVGHNQLLDQEREPSSQTCYDNMLFGCVTNNWKDIVDNTLVNTSALIAPEGYIVYPAIIAWLKFQDEASIRIKVAAAYAEYQKITIPESNTVFNVN